LDFYEQCTVVEIPVVMAWVHFLLSLSGAVARAGGAVGAGDGLQLAWGNKGQLGAIPGTPVSPCLCLACGWPGF